MKRLFVLGCLILATHVNADVSDRAFEQCTEATVNKHLEALSNASVTFGKQLALTENKVNRAERQKAYEQWAKLANSTARDIGEWYGSADIGEQSAKFSQTYLDASGNVTDSRPKVTLFENMMGDISGVRFTSEGVSSKIVTMSLSDDLNQKIAAELNCIPQERLNLKEYYLYSWTKAWSRYANLSNDEKNAALAELYKANEERWSKFNTEARYQYYWEKSLTVILLNDELSGDNFTQPPSLQIHFLRPWVVMEYVDKADDGSQFSEALSIEWLGVNFWKGTEHIHFPWGASLITTYSDRSGVNDVSYGLMLHVDNSYSFGVTARGDDIGGFVTVDLLKALTDAKSEIETWTELLD